MVGLLWGLALTSCLQLDSRSGSAIGKVASGAWATGRDSTDWFDIGRKVSTEVEETQKHKGLESRHVPSHNMTGAYGHWLPEKQLMCCCCWQGKVWPIWWRPLTCFTSSQQLADVLSTGDREQCPHHEGKRRTLTALALASSLVAEGTRSPACTPPRNHFQRHSNAWVQVP